MKKQLSILVLCLFGLNGITQNYPPSGTVQIINTNPNDMCDGDSMEVNFKFIFSGNPDTMIPHLFNVWIPPFSFYSAAIMKYTDFFHLKKNLVGSDTVYSFKFWYSSTNGKSYNGFSNNYPLGHNLVCTGGQLSCVTIHVYECIEPNGIKELKPDSQIPIYYDLYGNIIEPRKNEIIIEKVGNRRRKVVIQ